MQLSKAEEKVMTYLWSLESAYLKDLLALYGEPRPATTTLATLLSRMKEKGFINFTVEGRARKYFPLVKKKDYVSQQLKGFVNDFFGDSTAQFASFFTKSADLSKKELKELQSIINDQLKNK